MITLIIVWKVEAPILRDASSNSSSILKNTANLTTIKAISNITTVPINTQFKIIHLGWLYVNKNPKAINVDGKIHGTNAPYSKRKSNFHVFRRTILAITIAKIVTNTAANPAYTKLIK